MARLQRAALAAVAVVMLAAAAPAAGARALSATPGVVCVLPVTLDPTSAVAVGGVINKPLDGLVVPTNKAAFQGSLAVVFRDGCPTTANLKSALGNAFLSTPKSGGISIGQATANVKIGDTPAATLTIDNLKGIVTSKPGAAGVANPSVTATAGSIIPKSPLAELSPFAMSGRTISLAGSGCTLNADGAQVKLACPKVQARSKFELEAGGGELQIMGAINAAGKLADAKPMPASAVPGA